MPQTEFSIILKTPTELLGRDDILQYVVKPDDPGENWFVPRSSKYGFRDIHLHDLILGWYAPEITVNLISMSQLAGALASRGYPSQV